MKIYKKKFKEETVTLDMDLVDKILTYIQKNPFAPDDKFHAFAQTLSIEPDILEGQVYAIIADLVTGGKSKGVMPKDADPKEIEMGMKVEVEHCSIPYLIKKIVADHLGDNPKYYSEGQAKGIFDELK